MGCKGDRAGHPEALFSAVLEKVVTSDSQPPHLRGSICPFSAKQSVHPTFLLSATHNQSPTSWSAFPDIRLGSVQKPKSPRVKQSCQQSLVLVLFPQSPRKRSCTGHSDHSHRSRRRNLQGSCPYCRSTSPTDFNYF